MLEAARIAVVIPALNEGAALGGALARVPRWVDRVVVVDNGSSDDTTEVARAGGAEVLHEPARGYGRACLAGIRAVSEVDVIVFMDADGSDHPEQMERLVRPILERRAELVIGSRALGRRERGALTFPQRFGNVLASRLVSWLWGVRFTDLGPFRAISRTALERLEMDAPTFGWTVQMQIRAASRGLACSEVAVDYARRKAGRSKISGTVRGVWLAGTGILGCIARERLAQKRRGATLLAVLLLAAASCTPDAAPPAEAEWGCCDGLWRLESEACPSSLSVHVENGDGYASEYFAQLRIALWSDGSIVFREDSSTSRDSRYLRATLDRDVVRRAISDAWRIVQALERDELSCPDQLHMPATRVQVCLAGQWRGVELTAFEPERDPRCAIPLRTLGEIESLLAPLEDAARGASARYVAFGSQLTFQR